MTKPKSRKPAPRPRPRKPTPHREDPPPPNAPHQKSAWKTLTDAAENEVDRLLAFHRGGQAVDAGFPTFLALLAINRSLNRIARAVERLDVVVPPSSGPSLGLHLTRIIPKGFGPMPQIDPIQVSAGNDVEYGVSPKDAAGNPTTPTLTWASSDTAVLELTPAADGLTAMGVTKAAGVTTVSVTDGNITDSQELTLTAGATVSLGLTATVTPKP